MKLIILILVYISFFNYSNGDQIDDLKKLFNYKMGLMKTQFDSQLAMLKNEVKKQINNDLESTCEKDWISYSYTKCIKVLNKNGSELEAKGNCSQLDSKSTLITIDSKDEQNFLSQNLKEFESISTFVWIGLKFFNKSFNWINGKELNFQNWNENAIKNGNSKCVKMSLADSDLGQWTDDLCQKKYLIVCQKKHITKTVLSQEFEKITNVIERQQNAFDLFKFQINSLIPIGFLYAQLPDQSSPQELWPKFTFKDVTQLYSGLFFRVEGSGSETFGQIQQANYSRITTVLAQSCHIESGSCQDNKYYDLKEGQWSENLFNNDFSPRIGVYTTTGENRPRNTAIRLWKRIQ